MGIFLYYLYTLVHINCEKFECVCYYYLYLSIIVYYQSETVQIIFIIKYLVASIVLAR